VLRIDSNRKEVVKFIEQNKEPKNRHR
jgi:hypothetical protein